MRYSLLNFLACPASQTELACLVTKETECPVPHVRFTECDRVNQPGAMFGPAPRFGKRTWLTEFLQSNGCDPAPSSRTYAVAVEEGLLISGETGRAAPAACTISSPQAIIGGQTRRIPTVHTSNATACRTPEISSNLAVT